jgi:hypothetical protein
MSGFEPQRRDTQHVKSYFTNVVLSIVPLYDGLPKTMTYKHTCVLVRTIHGEPDSVVITV